MWRVLQIFAILVTIPILIVIFLAPALLTLVGIIVMSINGILNFPYVWAMKTLPKDEIIRVYRYKPLNQLSKNYSDEAISKIIEKPIPFLALIGVILLIVGYVQS
jgi:hypothetical protein